MQYAAPTPDEKRHHYLLRFWPALPGWGGMAVLDRSWYGRVLVERVEGFATKAEWRRAYGEINDFERALADDGHDPRQVLAAHLRRGAARALQGARAGPAEAWKLTDEDWRNREKRAEYEAAIEEMVERTTTEWAPWTLVEADSKRYARVKVLETVIDAIEAKLAVLALAVGFARLLLRRASCARAFALAPLVLLAGACVAQARRRRAGRGSAAPAAGVAHDEPAHHAEADDQRAADDEQRVAPGLAVVRASAAAASASASGAAGGSGPKAPDWAPAGAARARTSSVVMRAMPSRHGRRQGSQAGAPVNAQCEPANRPPHVTSRTAISATSPTRRRRCPNRCAA